MVMSAQIEQGGRISPKEIAQEAAQKANIRLETAQDLLSKNRDTEDIGTAIKELRRVQVTAHEVRFGLISEGSGAVSELRNEWFNRFNREIFLPDTKANGDYTQRAASLYNPVETPVSLRALISQAEVEMAKLTSGRIGRIIHRKRVADIRRQVNYLSGFLKDYEEEVDPSVQAISEVSDKLSDVEAGFKSSVTSLAERAIASTLTRQEAIEKQGLIVLSDTQWQSEANGRLIEDIMEPELVNGIIQGNLDRATADEIKAFALECLRTGFYNGYYTGHPPYNAEPEVADMIRERHKTYSDLQTRSKHNAEYYLRHIGLTGDLPNPNDCYERLGEVITNLIVSQPPDYVEDLLELIDYDDPLRSKLYQVANISNKININELHKIRGGQRWILVAGKLVENGVITEDEAKRAEEKLCELLVNRVLIPGGRESWDGTAAAGVLYDISTPRALPGLINYLKITGAGHTSARVVSTVWKIASNPNSPESLEAVLAELPATQKRILEEWIIQPSEIMKPIIRGVKGDGGYVMANIIQNAQRHLALGKLVELAVHIRESQGLPAIDNNILIPYFLGNFAFFISNSL